MTRALLASAAAAIALVAAYAALGGGGYDVDRPPAACDRAAPPARPGTLRAVERVGLTALNGAACDLGVTRERLLLVLAGEVDPPPGLTEERRNEAFRAGLRRAVDEEERAGRLGGTEALLLRAAIEIAPVDVLLDRVFGDG
ncbi:MAG TPA: hypothetical protein VHF89_19060 [Solirubrobacteraceae bacterium]|nr:hypothetical protein [Solirubrobacteraceae bacterium]